MQARLGVVAVGLLLAILAKAPVAAETIDVAKYANLAVGYGWTYQQSKFADPWYVAVDSVTTKDGHPVYLLQEYDWKFHENDQDFILSDFTGGMFEVGGLNDYGQVTQNEFYWRPPLPLLRPDLVLGQPYTDSHIRTDWPSLSIDYTVAVTREAVTVPLGTFADTLKVTETFSVASMGAHTEVRWYANGVGLVKRIQDDGNVWELAGVSGFTVPSPVPLPAPVWLLLPGLGVIHLRLRMRGRK